MGPPLPGRSDEFSIRIQRRPLLSLPDGTQVAPRSKVPLSYVSFLFCWLFFLFYNRLLIYARHLWSRSGLALPLTRHSTSYFLIALIGKGWPNPHRNVTTVYVKFHSF